METLEHNGVHGSCRESQLHYFRRLLSDLLVFIMATKQLTERTLEAERDLDITSHIACLLNHANLDLSETRKWTLTIHSYTNCDSKNTSGELFLYPEVI